MFDFFNSANQVWKITWLQFGGQLSKKKIDKSWCFAKIILLNLILHKLIDAPLHYETYKP